jgi:hypothetical protein
MLLILCFYKIGSHEANDEILRERRDGVMFVFGVMRHLLTFGVFRVLA